MNIHILSAVIKNGQSMNRARYRNHNYFDFGFRQFLFKSFKKRKFCENSRKLFILKISLDKEKQRKKFSTKKIIFVTSLVRSSSTRTISVKTSTKNNQ